MAGRVDEAAERARQVDGQFLGGVSGRDLARDRGHPDRADAVGVDARPQVAPQADDAPDPARHLDDAAEVVGGGEVVRVVGLRADRAVDDDAVHARRDDAAEMDQPRHGVVHRRVGGLLVVLRVDAIDVGRLAGVERDVADRDACELGRVHDGGRELNAAEAGHRRVDFGFGDLENVRVASRIHRGEAGARLRRQGIRRHDDPEAVVQSQAREVDRGGVGVVGRLAGEFDREPGSLRHGARHRDGDRVAIRIGVIGGCHHLARQDGHHAAVFETIDSEGGATIATPVADGNTGGAAGRKQ